MSLRYTNSDKWVDSWFSNLKPEQKLLFIYLFENCDTAGFIEINIKRWAVDLGYDISVTEGALKGVQRGLIYSVSNDCIYIRTFLKHQKNLPLNPEKNMAHRGIIKRFELYVNKFNISDINEFIEGALKGVQSPYGIGNGNGNGNVIKKGVSNFDFIDQIIQQYVNADLGYEIVNRGKERTAAGKILALYKKKYPNASSEETLEGLGVFFHACVNITEPWLKQNMSLSIISSKFNEIKKYLNNGNKRQTSNGVTDQELAQLLADKFATAKQQ